MCKCVPWSLIGNVSFCMPCGDCHSVVSKRLVHGTVIKYVNKSDGIVVTQNFTSQRKHEQRRWIYKVQTQIQRKGENYRPKQNYVHTPIGT